ncbi:hypothetical protein BJ322DRAFT_406224 [Thelephora terrestris]|uniref:C2 domain-containing protein n=1 Tax=Thelephora terrestris TaxID=56493 RepID=A0A9P6HMS7_9AGAM|nr:hypothetical protein BJ322DRAFT_406224 [Thelephora terrestris]
MSKEIGMLAVVVLKARNLHDRHSFYKQDPYAKVTLNGKTYETPPDVKGGQRPEWDAEFRFPVYAAKSDSARQMEVTCWRAEPRQHEEIGKGKVDISDTLKSGEFDDWVTINDVSGTYRGEIYLEMTFFASGPPPLERRPSKLPPQERLQRLKQSAAPVTAGGNLAVPGGANFHQSSPPKDKPLLTVHEFEAPGPSLPPTLRPGTDFGVSKGHGRRSSEYTSPVSSRPPPSLAPGRPPAHRNDSNPFRNPGLHGRTQSGGGFSSSYSPPRESNFPPSLSHSPPRQSRPEYNSYVSEPAPSSIPGSTYFPSPYVTTPPEPTPYNGFTSGASYSPPRHSAPLHNPPQTLIPATSTHNHTLSFPSVSPRPPSPQFHPPQSTSPYSVPQSTYLSSQPGYPQPQSTYPPPPQPGYPMQAPPQFPSHHQTFHAQPQGAYTAYEHLSPPLGSAQRSFFVRQDSVGELPDPSLSQRYASPLPLPNDGFSARSHSPFPVPTVPPVAPPPHPVPSPFSPSAEFERELQRKREQEERDADYARQLDFELNLGGA